MVNATELNKALKGIKDELINDFTAKIEGLTNVIKEKDEALNLLSDEVAEISKAHSSLNTKYEELEKKVNALLKKNEELIKENATLIIGNTVRDHKIKAIAKKLEDRTNRQLRKTLIFDGLPEIADEKWEDTTRIVAEKIEEVSNGELSVEHAINVIERAHRGRPSKHKQHRKIYAAITDWRESEKIKDVFFKKNTDRSTSKAQKVYCNQMYGSDTTWRRGQALKLRKDLKAAKTIESGYVKFPAKLMVRYPGNREFELYRNFSDAEVIREDYEDAEDSE